MSNYNAIQSNPPFPQLLNFMQVSGSSPSLNQFGRILDYVGVPSWFAGTDIQANPAYASAPQSTPGSHTFFPPYNSISTYREPGRINLNTIYTPDVFNGLMNGATSPTFDQFKQSRRGYPRRTTTSLTSIPRVSSPPNSPAVPFLRWRFTGAAIGRMPRRAGWAAIT